MIEPQSVDAARQLKSLIDNFNHGDLNEEQENVIIVCDAVIAMWETMTGPLI